MGFLSVRKRKPRTEADVVSILDRRTDGTTVKLVVKFEGKTWEELSSFMREQGFFREGDGLSLLFEYGVSEKEGIDIEKRHSEMMVISGRHSGMHFDAYTLFKRNQALAIALPVMLSDNRRLRKQAEERRLISSRRETWDDWDKETVNGFQRRYVFGR
jgi:hypothetical protein